MGGDNLSRAGVLDVDPGVVLNLDGVLGTPPAVAPLKCTAFLAEGRAGCPAARCSSLSSSFLVDSNVSTSCSRVLLRSQAAILLGVSSPPLEYIMATESFFRVFDADLTASSRAELRFWTSSNSVSAAASRTAFLMCAVSMS